MDLQNSLEKVKIASRKLVLVDDKRINQVLLKLADLLEENTSSILAANKNDLSKMEESDPVYDRVLLNEERIKDIAASVREISSYTSPLDRIIEEKTSENGLELKKISTPIGVIGVIFEARPNVLIDVFALCLKSKNASVLKGGSKSAESNRVLMQVVTKAIESNIPELTDISVLLGNDRTLISEFLQSDEYIDVIIPRGGKDLIDHVRKNSTIPVIETGAGVVHSYFDESGDIGKGKKIIFNAKTNRPSVCNSLDTLIINRDRLSDLPELCSELSVAKVQIFADKESYESLKGHYDENLLFEAQDDNFGTEYLSLKMSIKTVANLDDAIDHINKFGSGHSETIISEDEDNISKFMKGVDAAAVYSNASTRFTDGGVFGLGAEIGISTQKLHARGPMGINDLTSYKWYIRGDGQIRE